MLEDWLILLVQFENAFAICNHSDTLVAVRPSLLRHLRRHINPNIATLHLSQVLQQEASLEVCVGMKDGVEFTGGPE